jgi:hypothetical protein
MATWTNVLDSNLEPGDPIRSVDIIAIKDNTTALAEGATGAPEIYQKATQFSAKAQVYDTAGSYTFTIPDGVVRLKVTVIGGGGGGGGGDGSSPGSPAGAGGTAIKWLSVTSGTLSVTVGAGGTGGALVSSGSTGSTSSVASGTQSITTISATGGTGGSYNVQTTVNGGLGSNGDLNYRGGRSFPSDNYGGTAVFGGNSLTNAAGQYGGGGPGGVNNGVTGAAGLVVFEW